MQLIVVQISAKMGMGSGFNESLLRKCKVDCTKVCSRKYDSCAIPYEDDGNESRRPALETGAEVARRRVRNYISDLDPKREKCSDSASDVAVPRQKPTDRKSCLGLA